MDKVSTAAEIVKNIIYINIASVTPDGLPWNTPVYCAHDEKLNFFWHSWKENQHSVNLENNPNAFVTIYDSTLPEGTGVGVYFQGTVELITGGKDLLCGLEKLYKRKSKKVKAVGYFLNKFPRRVYKFTPHKVWINGEGELEGQTLDTREEVDLAELIKAVSG